jgi:DNA-binding XRE family transcriptional regulator
MTPKKPKRTLPTNGDKAREARKLAGFTNQHALAEALRCSYTKIVDIETGKGAEPWLIQEVANKIGLTFDDLVRITPRIETIIEETKLPGRWTATFVGREGNAKAKQLVAAAAILLDNAGDVLDFVWSKKTNSMLIAIRASALIHRVILEKFAFFRFRNIALQPDSIATISRLHFPRVTLDWPIIDSSTERSYILNSWLRHGVG